MKIFARVYSYSEERPFTVEVDSADLVDMWDGVHFFICRTEYGIRRICLEDRFFFRSAAGAANNDPADRFF